MNYYNDNDPKAIAWLEELIRRGTIPEGVTDSRSISDVKPDELLQYTQCHFFTGIGGWVHALKNWKGPIWTGSCPCQPFSSGGKGKGFDDERHLWPDFLWLIRQCKPNIVAGEQVASPAGRDWFDRVSTDLEHEGYAVGASVLPACSVGTPHKRERLFWVADTYGSGLEGHFVSPWSGNDFGQNCSHLDWEAETISFDDRSRRFIEPGLSPLVNGVPGRVGLLRGYGNAIVPQVAEYFLRAYVDSRTKETNNLNLMLRGL